MLLDPLNLFYQLVIHVESFGVILAINRLHHPSLFFEIFRPATAPRPTAQNFHATRYSIVNRSFLKP